MRQQTPAMQLKDWISRYELVKLELERTPPPVSAAVLHSLNQGARHDIRMLQRSLVSLSRPEPKEEDPVPRHISLRPVYSRNQTDGGRYSELREWTSLHRAADQIGAEEVSLWEAAKTGREFDGRVWCMNPAFVYGPENTPPDYDSMDPGLVDWLSRRPVTVNLDTWNESGAVREMALALFSSMACNSYAVCRPDDDGWVPDVSMDTVLAVHLDVDLEKLRHEQAAVYAWLQQRPATRDPEVLAEAERLLRELESRDETASDSPAVDPVVESSAVPSP